MAQKIRPDSFRLGIIKDWNAKWFSKNFKTLLEEDVLIRKIINKEIISAGIDKIEIERMGNKCKISVRVARPGLVIGRGGKGIETLTKKIELNLKKLKIKKEIKEFPTINLNIEEIKRSEVSATVIAQNIAWDTEKRMPFRRLIKKYLESIMHNKEVKGAKIKISGRLGGSEIARSEHLEKGSLPLHTLRANIDYGQATAFTTYGTIGIKVWIYKGDIFNENNKV